jgi:hypothetical protein
VSERALNWALQVKGRSISQKDTLVAMAKMADDDGVVGPLTASSWTSSVITLREAVKTAEGLLRLGYITKRWNPDRYVWEWTLRIKP